MDPTAQLPRPIAAWTVLRELFDDQLADGLETLIHRLSVGIELRPDSTRRAGEPNGYSGVTRTGPVSRLLLSELALADVFEDEFFRRLTQGEAGYYEVATVDEAPSGRMVVLFDAGPEQLGVARIGHLATILLLWRRAAQSGVRLEIGTLQRPDVTSSGELRELVVWWLESRTHDVVAQDAVAATSQLLSADDQWWVCCGEAVGRFDWPTGAGVITLEESGDSADGATHLLVRHRDRHARVPLPERADVIRLLRGRGFRRAGSSHAARSAAIRHPRFPGASAHVLGRTDEPDILVSVAVPGASHATTTRPKRRTFSGPVVAAGYIGTRTVAVVYRDQQLVIEVIGKQLSNVGGLTVPLGEVEVNESELDLIGAHAPRSIAFSGGDLYVDLPSGWWQIGAKTRPTRHTIVAAAPSGAPDVPYLVRAVHRGLWAGRFLADAPVEGPFVLGAGYIGWSERDRWVLTSLTSDDRFSVEMERVPVGIVALDGAPAFVALSNAGQIVRLIGRTTSTLTKASGDVLDVAVHPLKPLIAVQHHDHSITVHDVAADSVALRVGGDES
jgi:hypothetical protein